MEIKFHTRPTQIDRKNPIVVRKSGLAGVYMYHLKGDFYARFCTAGSTSMIGLVKTDDPMDLSVRFGDYTTQDVNSKNDLIDYVKSYRNTPIERIEHVYNMTF